MSKAKTKEKFVKESNQVHKNKYTYEKVVYKNTYTKVIITCPIHGDFEMRPHEHLRGYGCPKCKLEERRLSDFVEKAKKVHGDKYDYSKTSYINYHTKVCIICTEHGEFWQAPSKHLIGQGCPKCKNKNLSNMSGKKLTIEEILKRFNDLHNNKYVYDFEGYKNTQSIINIYCPIHGWFKQKVAYHLQGNSCRKCSEDANRKTKEEFIKQARDIHGHKYDYSKVEYINTKTKVCIICPKHGEFWMTPKSLLDGEGCPNCQNRYITKEQFIQMARKVHGDKYDYSKVDYVNNHTKVCIICPIHGEFWTTPNIHLHGYSCKECSKMSLVNENRLIDKLKKTLPDFEFVSGWKDKDILGRKEIDIYSEKYKIGIEYQGKQHFMPVDYFGGNEVFEKQLERDNLKIKECLDNNITLFHFTYDKNYNKSNIDYDVITDEKELIEKIMGSI